MGAHARASVVIDRAHFQVHRLEAAERALDDAQSLVGAHGVLGIEFGGGHPQGRCRARRPRLHDLPQGAPNQAPLDQPHRAAPCRDQAAHQRRRDLPQRGRHHPTGRRDPARTERRMGRRKEIHDAGIHRPRERQSHRQAAPPWQPERPGPTRRIPRSPPGSYTTARDTIRNSAKTIRTTPYRTCPSLDRTRCSGPETAPESKRKFVEMDSSPRVDVCRRTGRIDSVYLSGRRSALRNSCSFRLKVRNFRSELTPIKLSDALPRWGVKRCPSSYYGPAGAWSASGNAARFGCDSRMRTAPSICRPARPGKWTGCCAGRAVVARMSWRMRPCKTSNLIGVT